MSKYLAVAATMFKAQFVYRFQVAVNAAFTFAKVLLAVVLWGAIFGERDSVAGFTLQSMLTYTVVSSFLAQLVDADGVSGEISSRIRNGTFSKYMVVPVNVFGYFGAQTVGAAAFYLFFNLAAMAVWVLVFRIELTLSAAYAAQASLLVVLGSAFLIQLNGYLGTLAFKYGEIWIFLMVKGNLIAFASGSLIPLALLPGPVLAVMRWLPFYHATYLPSMLLIGRGGEEAAFGILTLLIWNAVMAALCHLTYNRYRVRYDGVGI